jgi:hypothetical protein
LKILLVTPPMTQMNSPYPATAYLTGFLQSHGYTTAQVDLGLEFFLKIFCKEGLHKLRDEIKKKSQDSYPDTVQFFLDSFEDYQKCIDPVIQFLQGKNSSLAIRISERKLLPEGPRFLPLREHEENLLSNFGEMGIQDKAKYFASLYLDDLSDMIKQGIDPDFEFSRYAERLASSQVSFTPLAQKLDEPPNLLDRMLLELVDGILQREKPDVIGFSIPFPGNLYAGLRVGDHVKKQNPHIRLVMGGGFINTELREISDPRFFKYVDYLLYDDGELPLLRLLDFFKDSSPVKKAKLIRCKTLIADKVQSLGWMAKGNAPFKEHPGPRFGDLPLEKYISMLEMPNPMHRLWSDFRWNKMVIAHGCYWSRCSFCDVNLDYIARYEPSQAPRIVDQMEAIMRETKTSGFHFVDEAAPPALLKAISLEIMRRGLVITWWGNLRFDKQFTKELCALMADAGCVAVTGGLEVASPRILQLINKGITVEQVAVVTKNFRQAGIFVHAYLMYGFPSQNIQETVDSLEIVRQLFECGCLQSAHWHRFLTTAYSPVGKDPQKFGVELNPFIEPSEGRFATYEIPFTDSISVDHDVLGEGLRAAVYNYMHGIGIQEDVRSWFRQKVPPTNVKMGYLNTVIQSN